MKKTMAELARVRGDVEKRWATVLKDERKSRHSDTYPSSRLLNDAYILAVGAYLLDHDVTGFVNKINLILQTVEKLYQRHESGEHICLVRNWPFQHEYFFYALCINDLQFATNLARKCGPEKLQPTEQQHPFNEELTCSVRLLLLDRRAEAESWIGRFEKRCGYKSNMMYAGYASALRAIHDTDSEALGMALRKVVDDYPRQSRNREFFDSIAKGLLCFYGVGVVHLARHIGLTVSFDDPLIPVALTELPPHSYVPPAKRGIFDFLLK